MTEELLARLEKPVDGGRCLARVEGRVVFVSGGLPGELVRIRLASSENSRSERFLRAEVVEVLEPSADRVPDRRAALGLDDHDIGGYEHAHVAAPASRRIKAEVVVEQFRRLGGIELGERLLSDSALDPGESPEAWRSRVQLAVDGRGRLGMRRARSHEVVPLRHAPLAVEALAALPLAEIDATGQQRIEFAASSTGDLAAILSGPETRRAPRSLTATLADRGFSVLRRLGERGPVETLSGSGLITERPFTDSRVLPDIAFELCAQDFWQIHPRAPRLLAERVLGLLDGIEPGRLADLYCGAGLLGLGPARAGWEVTGIEVSRTAVERAAAIAERAQLPAGFVSGRVEKRLSSLRDVDAVVLDPPRAGCGRTVARAIGETPASRIVYVSCDAATLARDVAYFAQEGFELSSLEVLDLFPLTGHVECVAALTRAS